MISNQPIDNKRLVLNTDGPYVQVLVRVIVWGQKYNVTLVKQKQYVVQDKSDPM